MNQDGQDDQTVLDVKDFLERVEGDTELACELAELFISDAAGKIVLLKEAITNQDAVAVERIAHSLKGASANLSANQVRELAWQLERAGAAGALQDAGGVFGQLEAALKSLEEMLKTRIINAGG